MKIKRAIAIIAPVTVVVLAAVFLPPFLWENHIAEISGKAESLSYSMDLSKKGLTKEEFAEIYANSGAGNHFIGNTDKTDVLDSAKNIIKDFAAKSGPETEKNIEDILSVANLMGFDERYQLINTESVSRAVDIVKAAMESYCNSGICYIGLNYEKKTGVIISMDMQILEDDGYAYADGSNGIYISGGYAWLEKMADNAVNYYAELGLQKDMSDAYIDYGNGIFFHMGIIEGSGYYESEKIW